MTKYYFEASDGGVTNKCDNFDAELMVFYLAESKLSTSDFEYVKLVIL